MDVFVCYSFKDKVDIESVVPKSFIDNVVYVKITHLPFCWKNSVENMILNADCVLCLVTKNVYLSDKIAWELQTAIKNGKKIFYLKCDSSAVLSERLKQHGIEIKTFDLFNEIKRYNDALLSKELLNDSSSLNEGEKTKEYFFEQYKMMVNTSEELGKRRQNMHSFFVALNGGIFSVIGLIVKDINDINNIPNGTVWIFFFASIIGCFAAYSWKKQTVSYKQLSSGKFKIINRMEKYLPAAVFQAEWHALAYGEDKKIYSAFTKNEKNIPRALMLLYILFICLGVMYIVRKFLI